MTPSIEDCERRTRAHGQDYSEYYEIFGPAQKRPYYFNVALRNKNLKGSLIKLLVDSWQEDFAVDIIKGIIIFVTCEEKCFSYRAIDGRIHKTEEEHMQSTHEEADSRMIFHIMSTPPGSRVVIRTIDTDVLIIILANMSKIDSSLRIWMEVGQQTKSNLRYINVNQLFNDYGTSICVTLPGSHAFIGCDYTSSFSRKGKVRPFEMLQKNEDAQIMSAKLGKEDRITEQNLKIAERFVCEIYGKRALILLMKFVWIHFQISINRRKIAPLSHVSKRWIAVPLLHVNS